MIQHVSITNYILIQSIHVDLHNGFNVFTGETGSGKSMLVDAINFVMGSRINGPVVGPNGDSARVEMLLSFKPEHEIHTRLEQAGLEIEEDGSVLVSREISIDGKSVSRINGRVCTLSTVKSVLTNIVDIHSQHETQLILDSKNHLNIVDHFAENIDLYRDYQTQYEKYQQSLQTYESFKNSDLNPEEVLKARKELDKLNTFNPSQDDYDSLEVKLNEMNDFEKNQVIFDKLLNILRRDNSSLDALYEGIELLEEFGDENLLSQYKDAYYNLEDVAESIVKKDRLNNFDSNEYERIQHRLYEYQLLLRKYGNFEGINKAQQDLLSIINAADNFNDLLEDHRIEVDSNHILLSEKAEKLTQTRKKAAVSLTLAIQEQLKDLLLDTAKFEISIEKTAFNKDGADKIQFLISMNKGTSLQPLDKVASGGEMSRLMLGLKVVLSKSFNLSTVIFDEIDTGVSGRAGLRIGAKMKMLGNSLQVITISHLSSVAACATHHYAISKSYEDLQTVTSVRKVTGDQRIEELALIMSGNITDATKLSAQELVNEGQSI